MGCGTGLVGEVLHRDGFNNIYGCDISPGVLAVARKKNKSKAYKKLIELRLGQPDQFPKDLTGRFDLVTGAGIFA